MKTGPPLIHHSYAYCLMRVYKVFRHFGEYSTKDEKHLAFLSPMAHNNGWKRCLFSVSLAFGTTNSDRSYSARDV